MEIVVGSENPVKVKCTKEAFSKVFPNEQFTCKGTKVFSGVSDQPIGNYETFNGAKNRALHAKSIHPHAAYWVGIEGGVRKFLNHMEAFAWVYIMGDENEGKAQSATFQLPANIQKLIQRGVELGHADDYVNNRKNSKYYNGIVGLLTNNHIDRKLYYTHAVILALVPFMHSDFYAHG